MDPDAPLAFPSVTHDVVPEVYEGGLKTWEGSFDLACYLSTHLGLFLDFMVKPCTIIEAGSGSFSSQQEIELTPSE